MFQGKMKAVTFSYDDGVTQDERLIKIFDKYGLKATFNINSGLLGKEGQAVCRANGKVTTHNKIASERLAECYRNHEIAVHTLTHPHLYEMDEDELERQVNEDRENLIRLSGQNVSGMAYPYGDCDARIQKILETRTEIQYARTVKPTYQFDVQENLLEFNPTIHHCEMDKMFELAESFLKMVPDSPKLFYIWGHSYEFDFYDGMWEKMEQFCEMISGHDDVFYGTNYETLLLRG